MPIFMPHNVYLGPPAGSVFGDIENIADMAEMFEMGVRSVLQDEVKVDTVAQKLRDFAKELGHEFKVGKIRDELLKVINGVKALQGIVPDVDDKDIEQLIADNEKRELAVGSIRGQITGLFLGVLKRILSNPEYAMKMTPKQIGDWFKMIRDEEHTERNLKLKEAEQDRENLKTKVLFFRAMSGGLSVDDINMFEADLRRELSGFIRDGGQPTVLEGELTDDEAPGEDSDNQLPEGTSEGA